LKFVRQLAAEDLLYTLARSKIAAQNSNTNLSAKNSQKLCSQQRQLAKAAKKRTSKKHMVGFL
jgi:hypothetical protein